MLQAHPVLVYHAACSHCEVINNFDAREQRKAEEKPGNASK